MRWTRRAFLSRLLMRPGVVWLPLGVGGGDVALRGSDPAALTTSERRMRESLAYTAVSPHGAAKQCGGCRFFESRGEAACGACAILGSAVDVRGHCNSWSDA